MANNRGNNPNDPNDPRNDPNNFPHVENVTDPENPIIVQEQGRPATAPNAQAAAPNAQAAAAHDEEEDLENDQEVDEDEDVNEDEEEQAQAQDRRKRKRTADDDAQAKKRQATEEMYLRQKEEFAFYMFQQFGLSQWEQVKFDANGKPLPFPAVPEGVPALSNANNWAGLLDDGVYQNPKYPGMLLVLKNGSVSPLEKPKNDKEFQKFMKASIDFLALERGSQEIIIDWPNAKYVSQEKLDLVLAHAKTRPGVVIKWGPHVEEFLDSRRDDKAFFKRSWRTNKEKELSGLGAAGRKDSYNRQVGALETTAATTKASAEYQISADIFAYRKAGQALQSQPKIEGDTIQAKKEQPKKDALKNDVYTGIAAGAPDAQKKKLDAIGGELTSLEARAEKVLEGKKKLDEIVDTNTHILETSQNADELTAAKQKVEGTAAQAERYFDQLFDEYKDLRARRDVWKEELTTMRAQLLHGRDPVANPDSLTPAEHKELKRIDRMLEKFTHSLDGINMPTQSFGMLAEKMTQLPEHIARAENDGRIPAPATSPAIR